MNLQSLKILRLLADPAVTRTPFRVIRELRRRGIQRLPSEVRRKTGDGVSLVRMFRFVRSWLAGEMLTRHRGRWVLNSFLPPFPGRAYDRMFENLLSGRHLSPVSAYLAVTARCPNRCWHCSLRNRVHGELDTRQWLEIVRQLHGLGASIIGFTGGEPAMRADLPELVAAATRGGAEAIVFTSGAGFSAALADKLEAAGLWALCVSLDHTDPQRFGELRGNANAFAEAVAAIELSVRHGFYTMVGTVARPALVGVGMHREIYALAATLGAHELNLIEPMRCGALAGALDADFLSPAQVAEIRRFHVETNRRGRGPKVCAFNQVESPEVFGCGGGTQHLFVDSAGEVCPCDFTPLSFGNALAVPLADIWLRMNRAMGDNPRRHCFVQTHHALITKFATEHPRPFPPEISERVCREAGPEPLPDYFATIVGRDRQARSNPP